MTELQNEFEGIILPDDEEETEHITANCTSLVKITTKYNEIKETIQAQKKSMDDLSKMMKDFDKMLNKVFRKVNKNESKIKQPRKPGGFAVPINVSDDLCAFMGREIGSKIARTDVNRFLMSYISEKHLQKPENKQIILPDDELMRLLGDDAKDQTLTHFNIQKYLNKHFENSGKQYLSKSASFGSMLSF